MRVAFVCAMPMELRPLVSKLALVKTRVGGLTAHSGVLGDREVVAVATGMGTQFAREATERLFEAVVLERVVVVGITGAVEDHTPIGTLVVPEVVVDGATGVEYRPAALGDARPRGKMWTTDQLLIDLDVIAGLRADGVVSLDMETAAVAEVCQRRGVPWSVFRVISDRATDGTVDEEVFRLSKQDGTPDLKAVVRYLLERPSRVSRIVRLARGAKAASEAAADAAIRACSAI